MYNKPKKGYNDIMLNVKDKKDGYITPVPDPIEEDDNEDLNYLGGIDTHFWGPGYDE